MIKKVIKKSNENQWVSMILVKKVIKNDKR